MCFLPSFLLFPDLFFFSVLCPANAIANLGSQYHCDCVQHHLFLGLLPLPCCGRLQSSRSHWRGGCGKHLRWATSRESYRRIASESYRSDSNHQRALAVIFHPKNTELGPRRPCVRCAAIRIARLAFVGAVFVPRGTAEWPARVDCVR